MPKKKHTTIVNEVPYGEWMARSKKDAPAKKSLIKSLKRAGFPLEYEIRKILEQNGFKCSDLHYSDYIKLPQSMSTSATDYSFPGFGETHREIIRELDIIASKRSMRRVKIFKWDWNIYFTTTIIGECKYSKDVDLLVFKDKDSSLNNFPIKISGDNILYPDNSSFFEFPAAIEKVIEAKFVQQNDALPRFAKFFEQQITHTACEQILCALNDFYPKKWGSMRRRYMDRSRDSSIRKKWSEFMKENEDKRVTEGPTRYFPPKVQEDFLKQNFDAYDSETMRPRSLEINLIFPMVVIDENRGLINLVMDSNNEIVDFEDIGCGIYSYVSENVSKYSSILRDGDNTMPIIICNLAYLEKCLKILENGMEKIEQYTLKRLEKDHWLLAKEIMFNLKPETDGWL